MKGLIMRLLGYVPVDGPAGYGNPWPPETHWVKRSEIPPPWVNGLTPPGRCPIKVRSPATISCFWSCDLDVGHEGRHRWEIDSPANEVHEAEHFEGSFTTEDAIRSWGSRPHLGEIQGDYAFGTYR